MESKHIRIARRHGVLAETRIGPFLATSLPVHFHEELQIILSEHRVVRYGLKGNHCISPLGSLYLIPPEVPHSAQVEERQPTWGPLRTLMVSRLSFEAYLGSDLRMPEGFSSPILSSSIVMQSFTRTHDAITAAKEDLVSEAALTTSLALLAQQAKEPLRMQRLRKAQSRMRIVREQLGSDLADPLSLSQIAATAGLSAFHVLREFRSMYGLTPHAFRTQLRIWRARDLMLSGTPIAEAAQSTGFSDHAHLTRTFHRIVGVPPSRYTKQQYPSRHSTN